MKPATDYPPDPRGTCAQRTIVLGISPLLLLDCLRRSIEGNGFAVVASSDNGTQTVNAALSLHPDVVMTTVTLPPFGGLDVITSISHTRSDIAIVAVVESATTFDAERALRAGATSCLFLDDDFEHCREVLQRAATGDVVMSRRIELERMCQGYDVSGQAIHGQIPPGNGRPSQSTPLSRREEQVLNLVARGRTINQIASDMVISPKTVKHHLSATYGKLGVHNRTDAVVTAMRHGIVRI